MDTRQRGLVVLLIGGAIFSLFAYWIAVPTQYPFSHYPAGVGGALLIGAPGCAAIVGLIELSTGQPFYKVEEAWAALKWWQKALGGLLIVVFGGAIAFTLVALLVA